MFAPKDKPIYLYVAVVESNSGSPVVTFSLLGVLQEIVVGESYQPKQGQSEKTVQRHPHLH